MRDLDSTAALFPSPERTVATNNYCVYDVESMLDK
jgi:hypothetical protein